MKRIILALLLILSGLISYWVLRPDIYLFDILNLRGAEGFNGDSTILLWAKNHFADAAWAGAVYLVASHLWKIKIHRVYIFILMLLPAVSEILQITDFIKGTFDWVDFSIYIVLLVIISLKTFPMKKLQMHIIGFLAVAVSIFGIIASGTSKPAAPIEYTEGEFVLQPKQDDIFTKTSLSEILNVKDNISIVLRVPASEEDKITEAQKQINNNIYSTIEKEFAKADYIVRDRAMFAKALGDEDSSANYSEIHKSTDTDLILELVSYGDIKHNTNKYFDVNGSQQTASANFTFTGTSAEFKLVSVKDNDLVGSYTFYYTPCVDGCRYRFVSSGYSNKLYPVSSNTQNSPYEYVAPDVLENFFRECSLRLINELSNVKG